jgi:hypothetical protein
MDLLQGKVVMCLAKTQKRKCVTDPFLNLQADYVAVKALGCGKVRYFEVNVSESHRA